MLNTILGSKVRMDQAFVGGKRIPVTLVKAGPCIVTQVKRQEKDGYWAVQLGLGTKRIKNISKPLQGHLKGAIDENKAPRFLREVRLESTPELNVGDKVKASDVFNLGDMVAVTGVSKGKGFAGGVKRWHFAGGPKTHGQSDRQRAPGSIGQGTTPGRVLKGKHMAGRMGSEQVTVKNLQIISINPETDEIELSGPIPGNPEGLLIIRKIKEGKLPELEIKEVKEQEEAPAETKAAEGQEVKAEEKPQESKKEEVKNES